MTITKHFTAEDFSAALSAGDTTVCKHIAGTVSVRITVERDHDCDIPSPEVYDETDIALWESGEWTFWSLSLSVYIGSHCINRLAASIGGVDCVDDKYLNANHLADLANDLMAQANVPAIVRSFARKVAAAADAIAST